MKECKECFVLLSRDFEQGDDASVFWKEEDARKAMEEDAETVRKSLEEGGYEPYKEVRMDSAGVIVGEGDDIFYEWNIILSEIV